MKTDIKVMLCEEGNEAVLDQPGYAFEIKYDGEYGQLHVLSDGSVRIWNRAKRDITDKFPEIALDKTMDLPPDSIFVGEIYVPANKDIKDKPTTSGRCVLAKPAEISLRSKLKPAVFMCFDCIRHEGTDIQNANYGVRKIFVYALGNRGSFHVVEQTGDGRKLWELAKKTGEEGVVAKRLDSVYENRRSHNWLKLKTWLEEDFRVLGWTSEKREVSALILEGLFKVNFAVSDTEYARLAPLIMANPQRFMAKVKYLNKSPTGLRFPVMRDIYEVATI